MNFSNKYLLYFIIVIIKLLVVLSAPVTNAVNKRSYIPEPYVQWNIYFIKPNNWGNKVYAYVYSDDPEINADEHYGLMDWPGRELYINNSDFLGTASVYYYNFPQGLYNKSRVIFTDGIHQAPHAMQEGFLLFDSFVVYTENGYIGNSRQVPGIEKDHNFGYERTISVLYKIDVGKIENAEDKSMYIHFKIGGRSWTEVPGNKMWYINYKDGIISYEYLFEIYENEENVSFVFTDGNDHWDNNDGKNYNFNTYDDIEINSKVKFY